MKNKPLRGYGQYYRSGITTKQKWATERQMKADGRQFEQDRLTSNKPKMGKNG